MRIIKELWKWFQSYENSFKIMKIIFKKSMKIIFKKYENIFKNIKWFLKKYENSFKVI